jgi:hypothetical protein
MAVDESNLVVDKVTSIDTVKNNKVPLSSEQLLEIWKQDEYWGQGGSYDCNPFTGKRTLKED